MGSGGRTALIVIVSILACLGVASLVVVGFGALFVLNYGDPGGQPMPEREQRGAHVEDFTGLGRPAALAVTSDFLYVLDVHEGAGSRVLKRGRTSGEQTVLPLGPLTDPTDVAVLRDGTVYVTDNRFENDAWRGRVLVLAAGATAATEMPTPALGYLAAAEAVDAGRVYLAELDRPDGEGRVLAFYEGARRPTVLVDRPGSPRGLAMDGTGLVLVADASRRLVDRVPVPGAGTTQLPVGTCAPVDVSPVKGQTMNAACADGRVLRVGPDVDELSKVPFPSLSAAFGVAVYDGRETYVSGMDGDVPKVIRYVA